MNSVRESKQELEASIRYAENAISSAKQTIESMEFRQEMAQKQYAEQTGREAALEREVDELTKQVEFYTKKYNELVKQKEASSGPCGCQAYRDLEERIATMPVIPKDVAIAIFREGIKQGVYDVCDELDNTRDIEIEESGYTGSFEVSFSRYIDLSEHLDLDWIREKVGAYEELNVINALVGLCTKNNFECRIHGIDDQGDDSKGA